MTRNSTGGARAVPMGTPLMALWAGPSLGNSWTTTYATRDAGHIQQRFSASRIGYTLDMRAKSPTTKGK
jgi:hypothetical protein